MSKTRGDTVPCAACYGKGTRPNWGVPGSRLKCPHCTGGRLPRVAGEKLKAEFEALQKEMDE